MQFRVLVVAYECDCARFIYINLLLSNSLSEKYNDKIKIHLPTHGGTYCHVALR